MSNQPVTRLGDLCTGHPYPTPLTYPPRPSDEGSGNVFVNSIAAHRQTDTWAIHSSGPSQHPSFLAAGSPTVYVNSLELGRITDPVACGSEVAQGSPNVYAGTSGTGVYSPQLELVIPKININPIVARDPVEVAVTQVGEDAPMTQPERDAYVSVGLDPDYTFPPEVAALPEETKDEVEPPPATDVPSDCTDIYNTTTFTGSFQLTPNFVLSQLTTNCAISRYPLRAQLGLSEQDIVCALRKLCLNLLEPITAQFGRPTITSGFRHGTNSSWHNKGSATDIQWSSASDGDYYDRIVWIKENLSWSELIIEYGGNRPWLHVAYNSASVSTTNFKTRVTVPNGYKSGLYKLRNVPHKGGIGVG